MSAPISEVILDLPNQVLPLNQSILVNVESNVEILFH